MTTPRVQRRKMKSDVPIATRFRLADGGIPEGFFMDYTLDGDRVKRVTLEQPAPQLTLVLTPVS